jgi:3-oxoacyl-[acyl-carrier protein] reductase
MADNADPDTPGRLIAAAQDTWARLDGALISVGGPPKGPVTRIADEQWSTAFESVFLGAVRLSREIGQALPSGGSLALVLSSSVRAPLADMAISNGLRPGLAMVAKTLADELGPHGVRVNGLMPGRVATERVAELDAAGGDPEGARAASIKTIPLGRYGEPEEFGRTAAFLLSPAASFITGAMVPVDGGMLRAL